MKVLPLGVPKVMLSTLASGMVRQFVGDKDIFMLNSVVDIAGLNRVSRPILSEAARAMAGLVAHPGPAPVSDDKPLVAATMFGVTTPCVERARDDARARRLRSARLPCHREWRPGDGVTHRRRVDCRRARHHDDRARRRARRGLPERGSRTPHRGRPGGHPPGRLDRRDRHGELLRPRLGARAVRGSDLLQAQCKRHVDAHDAGRERRDRRRHRAQAFGGNGSRVGAAASTRRVRHRPRRASRSTIRPRGGRSTRRFARGSAAPTSWSWICTSTIRSLRMRRRGGCST